MGTRAKRGGGMFALGDVQDLAGCGPSQPHHVGLAVLGRAGLGASVTHLFSDSGQGHFPSEVIVIPEGQ